MTAGKCGGGVVEQSTPQSNANKTNNYVHICTMKYLNLMELV
jgi:hypothetical protein